MTPLTELNPRWTGLLRPSSGEGIVFDCPTCGPKHQVVAYFSNPIDGKEHASWQKPVWERIGETFEQITIRPSIQYPCFHGWVERGRVFKMSESPLVVFGKIAGGAAAPVALSPEQALDVARQTVERANAMLGIRE